MANNILIDQGSTTTLGTDDCAGTHISLCKLVDATEDSTTRTGVAANPLQVSLANHGANATAVKVDGSAVTQPVSGTVAVTGVATAANQSTMLGYLDGVEGLLTTVDADTSVLAAALAVADDGTTPPNPLMVGGFMKNFDGTTPGIVSAEDDVVRFITDPNRRQYVNTVHPQFWSYHSDGSSALTDASVQGAPASGYSIFVTDIIFSIGAATACNIFFEEGSTKVLGPYYLEAIAGRGLVLKFTTPKQITAATALTVTTSAAIAQGLDVMGFIAKV